MGLADLLAIPELGARFRKIKPYFSLRSSTYDISADCQLRCQGCSYFASSMSEVTAVRDAALWRELFAREQARGITYAVMGGAEPSLYPDLLRACAEYMPTGTIVTNGLRPVPRDLERYRLHISIWGDETIDPIVRPLVSGTPGRHHLRTVLSNYAGDPRVVFTYTFNAGNVDAVDEPAARIADAGHRLTFSVFTSPEREPHLPLRITGHLARVRDKMFALMDRYPEAVLYSPYNAEVHAHELSLHGLFGCVFPRGGEPSAQVVGGVGSTYRSYRADRTHAGAESCCTPGSACSECRTYAAGAVIVPANLHWHAQSDERFRAWLDYFDTYLSVFIVGYERSPWLAPRTDVLSGAVPGPLAAR